MPLHRLTTTDAFVVIDVPAAPVAVGVVRCARKILTDGAELLARSVTYTAASFDVAACGASAGINAEGDARDPAVAAFADEVNGLAPDTRLLLTAGKGVRPDELAQLGAPVDAATRDRLIAVGALAAARRSLDSLDGVVVAIDDVGGVAPALVELLADTGAQVLDGATLPDAADVWFVGSKVGLIDHELAARMQTRLVVPIGPLPVTARGLAVAGRNGTVVLPDFLTCAGPVLAALESATDQGPGTADQSALDAHVAELVTDRVGRVIDHEHGPLLGACFAAETFLANWTEEPPFGRPLA